MNDVNTYGDVVNDRMPRVKPLQKRIVLLLLLGGAALIVRDWHEILQYELTPEGHCPHCHTALAGRFAPQAPTGRGRRRVPVRVAMA